MLRSRLNKVKLSYYWAQWCRKSTLLKILSRITEPTAGRIAIKGRVASLLEVGTGFHPELTGRENIYLNGSVLGMSRAEIKQKFDEIVAFAEVEKFLDTPVKRYSSGMYVRLAFSVAAHLEPEILVVDEVLAVGDSAFQKKCLGKMGDVATKEDEQFCSSAIVCKLLHN
jgi:ABC-type polysaccharide/polyol phosphate transport system ATPase subunit